MDTPEPIIGTESTLTNLRPFWWRIVRYILFLLTQFLPVIVITWLPAFIGTVKLVYNHPEVIFYDYYGHGIFYQFLNLRPFTTEAVWGLGFWGFIGLSLALTIIINLYWVKIFNKSRHLRWLLMMSLTQFILASIIWFFASPWFAGSWFQFSPFFHSQLPTPCCL